MLVRDINQTVYAGSNPSFYTPVTSMLYFRADDGIHGMELWKSDGTGAGTTLVKDINLVPDAGSDPYYLTAVNGTLYFAAFEEIHGRELWQSDGTGAGTVLVKDIFTGTSSSNPAASSAFAPDPEAGFNPKDPFPVLNGTLYFIADDGMHGSELWKLGAATSSTSSSSSTSIPSTTTTMVPCPLSRFLYSREDISMLRSARAVLLKTPYGTFLAALYYRHALEVVYLLEKQPELQQQMRELAIDEWDLIRQFFATGKLAFSGHSEIRAIQFLEALRTEAGPQLQNDIETIIRDLKSGSVKNKLEREN